MSYGPNRLNMVRRDIFEKISFESRVVNQRLSLKNYVQRISSTNVGSCASLRRAWESSVLLISKSSPVLVKRVLRFLRAHGPSPLVVQHAPGEGQLRRHHLAILPRGHREGPVLSQRKFGSAVVVPSELLRADGAVEVGRGVGGRLGVVHNVVFGAVRAGGEAGVASAVDALVSILMEDAAVTVLAPRLILHGVVADQLEHAQAVKGGVDAGGRVNDKVLSRGRVDELLRPLVGGQSGVGAAEGHAFPGLVGHGDDAAVGEIGIDGPGVGHVGDAEVGGPGGVLVLPARVNVVDVVVVEKVSAVDGELVVGVEFGLQGEVGGPGIGTISGQDEHAVVDGGTVDGTQCILQRRRVVGVGRGSEDDVPDA